MTETSYAATLKEAVSVFDTQGWTRGWLIHPDTNKCCSLGAIGVARGYIPKDRSLFTEEEWEAIIDDASQKLNEDPVVIYLSQALQELYPADFFCGCDTCIASDDVIGWNDSETEENVRAGFRHAIEKAEAAGV